MYESDEQTAATRPCCDDSEIAWDDELNPCDCPCHDTSPMCALGVEGIATTECCGHPTRCNVPVPARTLQPGHVTDDGRTVLRVVPEVGGRLHVRFEGDDTLWRIGRDSIVWIRRTA